MYIYGKQTSPDRYSLYMFDFVVYNANVNGPGLHTVYLVIFAGLNFREFLILGFFTKFRIREFLFFFSIAIRIIIFARFLNSRICSPREIREN